MLRTHQMAGNVTLPAFRGILQGLYASKQFDPDMNSLWDLRLADFSGLMPEDVRELMHVVVSNWGRRASATPPSWWPARPSLAWPASTPASLAGPLPPRSRYSWTSTRRASGLASARAPARPCRCPAAGFQGGRLVPSCPPCRRVRPAPDPRATKAGGLLRSVSPLFAPSAAALCDPAGVARFISAFSGSSGRWLSRASWPWSCARP